TVARLKAAGTPAFRGGEHGDIVCDVVEIRYGGETIRGPLFPVVGHPSDAVTVHLGYGRRRAGHGGTGLGFNADGRGDSEGVWWGPGAEIVNTGERYSVACTQYHHLMEGRGLVRAVTREEFLHDPKSVHEEIGGGAPGARDETPSRTITLYPAVEYTGYKWGM